MRDFDEILEIAIAKQGSHQRVIDRLSTPKRPEELFAIPDDRWLSMMTVCVFRAGFNRAVIDTKWPGFEIAFEGFDPARVGFYAEEELDRLFADKAIVRNGAKIKATLENARFVESISKEHGGFGSFVANWPVQAHHKLLEVIAKRGSRLGTVTGQRFLRNIGRDTYAMTPDVVARLVAEGVVDTSPTSKRAMANVQEAFNTWMSQSGRGLTQISQTLALSV